MVLLAADPAVAPTVSVDPPIAVTWDAPEGCPGVDELRAEIRRLAGPAPAPAELPSAQASVRRGPKDTWQLTLLTRAGTLEGERRLVSGDCVALMRATALVLALMINPSAGAPEPPPPPPPRAPPPVVAAPPPPAAPEPRLPRFAAGIDLLVGTGVLPGGATAGLGGRLVWFWRALSIEGRANFWRAGSATSPGDASTGGAFERADGAVAGCATARRARRVSPGICLGVSLSRAHGSGFGVSDPSAATGWWTGGLVEGNVRFRPTARNAVRVAIEGFAPFGRPTFALEGIGPVWTPAAFGARATLGWELNF
jgi:hypothetical protein